MSPRLSLDDLTTNAKPADGADQRARPRGRAGERQETAALRDFDSTYVGFGS
jgi:hypothetical protein